MDMKCFLSCAAFLGSAAAFAAEPWEDPSVNAINRLPARALTIPCDTEEMAVEIARRERPQSDSSSGARTAMRWSPRPAMRSPMRG